MIPLVPVIGVWAFLAGVAAAVLVSMIPRRRKPGAAPSPSPEPRPPATEAQVSDAFERALRDQAAFEHAHHDHQGKPIKWDRHVRELAVDNRVRAHLETSNVHPPPGLLNRIKGRV